MTWVRVPQKVWQGAVILLLTIMITLHLRILFMSNNSELEEDFSEDRSLCNRPVVVSLNSKANVSSVEKKIDKVTTNHTNTTSPRMTLRATPSSKPKLNSSSVTNTKRQINFREYINYFERLDSQENVVKTHHKSPLNSSQTVMKWVELDPKLTKVVGHHRPKPGFLTIGVPSIKRVNGPQYLIQTINSIIDKTSARDQGRVVVVVFLADFDLDYNDHTVKKLSEKFMPYINLGFLQIVQASRDFYPQLDGLKRNFNDKPDRVTWRSKQVADFAFMFLYSRNISWYYIQIEDDVVCARNFVPHIEDFINSVSKGKNKQWALLEFSELGFIGKLFKSADLHKLAQYMLTFYDEQPVDWLITYFRFSMAQRKILMRKPTLFQHMGLKSSFDTSKDNKLKDKYFDGGTKHHLGDDPPAKVITQIKCFEKNTPDLVYAAGSGFFWAVDIKEGDSINIVFDSSHILTKVVVETGNAKSPKDLLKHGSVYLSPKLKKVDDKTRTVECADFVKVGEIREGRAEIPDLDIKLNGTMTKCLRVRVDQSQDEWVVFDQIAVYVKS